jgi:hypothetical protein
MQGGSQYGQRSIMDQVGEYVRCSRQNQRMFRTPQVLFAFANGVTSGLANSFHTKFKGTPVGFVINLCNVPPPPVPYRTYIFSSFVNAVGLSFCKPFPGRTGPGSSHPGHPFPISLLSSRVSNTAGD